MGYSVGEVAGFAKVTVRTLHHYDEIGLLRPSTRNTAGHRRYSDDDLMRLQQILYYRELGFSLDDVAVILDDPDADPVTHLRRQHTMLKERISRLEDMAAAVEQAMEARKMGINLTPEERFEVFGDTYPESHDDEVRARWGNTGAYRESQRRVARYTKEDWLRQQEQMAEWGQRFVAHMESGAPADGAEAMDLAEEHRQHIIGWFYECEYKIHTALAEMYVSDDRFRSYYEGLHSGMAAYLHTAILANAARHA